MRPKCGNRTKTQELDPSMKMQDAHKKQAKEEIVDVPHNRSL